MVVFCCGGGEEGRNRKNKGRKEGEKGSFAVDLSERRG